MKNVYKKFIMPIVACLIAILAGCSDNDLTMDNGNQKINSRSQLGVSTDHGTRTTYTENGNIVEVRWKKNDMIKLVKVNTSEVGADGIYFKLKDEYDGEQNAIFELVDTDLEYQGTPDPNRYNPEIAYRAIYPFNVEDPTTDASKAFFQEQLQTGKNMDHVGLYNVMVGYKKPGVEEVSIYKDAAYTKEGMGHVSSVIKTIIKVPSTYSTGKPQIVKLTITDNSNKVYIVSLNLKNVPIENNMFPAYFTVPFNIGIKHLTVDASLAKKGSGTSDVVIGSTTKEYDHLSQTIEFGKMYDLKVDLSTETIKEAEGIDMGNGTIWGKHNLGVTSSNEADYGKYYQWGEVTGYTWGQLGISVSTARLDGVPQSSLLAIFGRTINSSFSPDLAQSNIATKVTPGPRVDFQGMIVTITEPIIYLEDQYQAITSPRANTPRDINGNAIWSAQGTGWHADTYTFYYEDTPGVYKQTWGYRTLRGAGQYYTKWYTKKDDTSQIVLATKEIYQKSHSAGDVICPAGQKTFGDAATAEWGAAWQMPTVLQLQELIEHCYKNGNVAITTRTNSLGQTVYGYAFRGGAESENKKFFYPAGGAWDGSWGPYLAKQNWDLRYYTSTSATKGDQGSASDKTATACEMHLHIQITEDDQGKITGYSGEDRWMHVSHARDAACPIRPVARYTNTLD